MLAQSVLAYLTLYNIEKAFFMGRLWYDDTRPHELQCKRTRNTLEVRGEHEWAALKLLVMPEEEEVATEGLGWKKSPGLWLGWPTTICPCCGHHNTPETTKNDSSSANVGQMQCQEHSIAI